MTASLFLLVATIGQVDANAPRFVPQLLDVSRSLELRDGEYCYTLERRIGGELRRGQAVSRDLVRWTERKGPLRPEPRHEPELQLPLDGDVGQMRWLQFGGACYQLGTFDGKWFSPRPPMIMCPSSTYPLKIGKRYLQIVSPLCCVPHEIALVTTPDGPRLTRLPRLRELDVLHGKALLGTRSLAADAANPLADLRSEYFDVQTKIRPGSSKATVRIRGIDIVYDGAAATLTVDGKATILPLVGKEIELRILTSDGAAEIFVNGGRSYIAPRIEWKDGDTISVKVTGDPVLFRWLDVFELRSPDVLGKGPATDITKETFGVTPVAESKVKSGFVIAGKNPTESLAKLTEIHGRKIAALEFDMRPGALARAGFLGDKEKLLDVLVEDNRTVVDKLGWSHWQLALPLRILGTYAQEKATKEPIEFVYRGHRYQARAEIAKAHIESPFEDGLSTNVSVTLWNLDNGKSLTYSMMVPHLIERYGFYEGHGTSYRVEPGDIVEVLDLRR